MPIYLDHNATTPLAPQVADAMRPFLEDDSVAYGNPSSGHAFGHTARAAVDLAREQVAAAIGAEPDEIVFTGCGSEANTLALVGSAKVRLRQGKTVHAVTSTIEHPAVHAPLDDLVTDFKERVFVTRLAVDGDCRLDLSRARGERPADLASVMLANNETGTLQPVERIRESIGNPNLILHVDAAQAVGKVPVDVQVLGADLLTVVGHKIGAPKGIAALFVKRGTPLVPVISGGGHEGGRRAGTENVILAAGLGAACALVTERIAAMKTIASRRDALESALRRELGERVVINGCREHRLPNTLHVSVLGVRAPDVLAACPEVAASTGSACHEDSVTLSPVLDAMAVGAERGAGAFRFSLGPETTDQDIAIAAEHLLTSLKRALL